MQTIEHKQYVDYRQDEKEPQVKIHLIVAEKEDVDGLL